MEQILQQFEREFLQDYDTPQDLASWQERLRFLEEELIPLSPKLEDDWVVEDFVSECRESIRELQLKLQASSQASTADPHFEESGHTGEYEFDCQYNDELHTLPGGVMALDLHPGDANGVSHHCLSVDSISKAGLILNNQVNTRSDVPGLPTNEVLGRHPTKTVVLHMNARGLLKWEGLIEVAGQAARVVLITKGSLVCDGCGTVNAEALDIQVKGEMHILGEGTLLDKSLKQQSLRAETLHLTSPWVSPELRLTLTGAGSVLTGTGSLGADSLILNAPNGWIDWHQPIQTHQGDLLIKTQGNLSLSRLHAAKGLSLHSGGTATLSQAYAGGKLSITALEGIELKGPITSVGPLAMDAPSVTQEGEVHAFHEPCPLDLTTESWTHRGQFYLTGTPWLDVDWLNNQGGLIDCQGNITLSLSDWDNQNGTLGGQWLYLSVLKNLNSNNGRIEASQGLSLMVKDQLSLQNGFLLANSSRPVRMTAKGRLDNRQAVISVQAPELLITTSNFDNTDGLVEHQGDLVLVDTTHFKNNKGRLNTPGTLRLRLQDLILGKHDNVIGEKQLSLVAKHWIRVVSPFNTPGDLTMEAASLNVAQSAGIHSQGATSLAITEHIENRGSIESHDDLTIEAQEVVNHHHINSDRELSIHARLTTNSPGAMIASTGNQWLATRLDNTEATVFSGRELDVTDVGSKGRGQTWLDNQSGRIEALGSARIEVGLIRNTQGEVVFDRSLVTDTLHGQCDDCKGRHRAGFFTHRKVWQRTQKSPGTMPQILSGNKLSLKSQRLKSEGGLISAGTDLSIRSDDISLDSSHALQTVHEKHYRGSRLRKGDFQRLFYWVNYYGTFASMTVPSYFWPLDAGGSFQSSISTPDRLSLAGEKIFEQGAPLLATTLQGGQSVVLNGRTLAAGLSHRPVKPERAGLRDSPQFNTFPVQAFGGAAQYGSGRQAWTPADLPGLHHFLSPAQDGQPWRFVSITPMAHVRANSLVPLSLPWNPYRRLADDAGDRLLVRTMITHATGMRFLAPDIDSDDDQVRRLVSNARDESQRLGLAPAMPLSAEQIQSLEKDILWYQTLELDGETLLAPALYLAKRPGGVNLLAGKTMNLELSSVQVSPSAKLAAGQVLSVKSEHFKSEGH
ncbi:filamentous hemagglutinin N-terminal domain-containing protein [Endozoicomonas numazuensis]|nr:filamentous hemagglutinin N-terminal domain-containing protein [Endozoicomonas numazuensis]